MEDIWQSGAKVRWTRMLERRPLAVVDLDCVTIAARFAPMGIGLKEVAGVFPIGWFDPVEPAQTVSASAATPNIGPYAFTVLQDEYRSLMESHARAQERVCELGDELEQTRANATILAEKATLIMEALLKLEQPDGDAPKPDAQAA